MRPALAVSLLSSAIIATWGLWGFFGKLALNRQMPATSVFLAEVAVGAAVGCVMLAIFSYNGQMMPWTASANVYGLLSGVGMGVGLLLFYVALDYGKAVVVVPPAATYPLVTVLLSYLFLGERPTSTQWCGLALVVVGAALLLSGPILTAEDSS
jgi:transporter family protein